MRPRLHFILVLLAVALAHAAQDAPDDLPDGNGRQQVRKICAGCHDVSTVTGARRTQIGWQRNVEDMVARGADGSEEDMRAVVDYLTKFFGKINVNTASAKELETFLGLSDQEAQSIVVHRQQNGAFKDFEQLTKVPGLRLEKLQAKRPQIAFSL